MFKRRLPLLLLPLFLLSTLISFASTPQPAGAVTSADWRAGRIMDEAVFRNKFSMDANQVQAFLQSKVPNCDTWGTKPSEHGGGTRAQFGAANGVPPPYTCLKDYREGSKSAAQIIVEAGQVYGINPQVLIVLLQKEQNLVTDEWPWPIQYKKATGYGCPDTAPCDTQYYGFTNQVNWAAKLFKAVINKDPNWYSVYNVGNNTIRWNPQQSCGGSNVYIENTPTAALYNYTPYQPNQAALNNLYGLGDGCSSYGNRNFWRLFNDWFGSGLGGPFNWMVTDLYIMDEKKNAYISTDQLHKGERMFVTVKGKNIGTETWYRDGVGPNPARLGTYMPNDRQSNYCDALWLSMSSKCSRAAKMHEDSVAPGQVFHFETYIHAPNQGGQYREYFQPLLEGRAWMSNYTGFHIYVNSTDRFSWQWAGINAWTNANKTTPVNLANLGANQQVYIEVKAKNTSATTWNKTGSTPARLGVSRPIDGYSAFCTAGWIACNRPASMVQTTIVPGQTANFGFTIKAPSTPGEYREYFSPLLEGRGWMRDDLNHLYVKVTH